MFKLICLKKRKWNFIITIIIIVIAFIIFSWFFKDWDMIFH